MTAHTHAWVTTNQEPDTAYILCTTCGDTQLIWTGTRP